MNSGSYKECIKKTREVYVSDGEYSICPLVEEDRIHYVELHKQLNGEETLYLNPYCKDSMWEYTLTGKDEVYSIFDAMGDYCGSIELQNPFSNTPEIGIELLESKRNQGIAIRAVKMFARKTYKERQIDYYLIRIQSSNFHSIHVFEKMGAIRIGRKDNVTDMVLENVRSIIGDDDVNGLLDVVKNYMENELNSVDEVYEYKLLPEAFLI